MQGHEFIKCLTQNKKPMCSTLTKTFKPTYQTNTKKEEEKVVSTIWKTKKKQKAAKQDNICLQ